MKPKIELWDTVGTGIISLHPTGIIVSNQTGGTTFKSKGIRALEQEHEANSKHNVAE